MGGRRGPTVYGRPPKKVPRTPLPRGPELLTAIRNRMQFNYQPGLASTRFVLAKRDVNALLGEIEMRDKRIAHLEEELSIVNDELDVRTAKLAD